MYIVHIYGHHRVEKMYMLYIIVMGGIENSENQYGMSE